MPAKAIGSTQAKVRTMHVDVPDSALKGVSVGEMVDITVRGKVTGLEASRTLDYGPKDKEKIPANIAVQVSSVKVSGENEFESMADEDMAEVYGD